MKKMREGLEGGNLSKVPTLSYDNTPSKYGRVIHLYFANTDDISYENKQQKKSKLSVLVNMDKAKIKAQRKLQEFDSFSVTFGNRQDSSLKSKLASIPRNQQAEGENVKHTKIAFLSHASQTEARFSPLDRSLKKKITTSRLALELMEVIPQGDYKQKLVIALYGCYAEKDLSTVANKFQENDYSGIRFTGSSGAMTVSTGIRSGKEILRSRLGNEQTIMLTETAPPGSMSVVARDTHPILSPEDRLNTKYSQSGKKTAINI